MGFDRQRHARRAGLFTLFGLAVIVGAALWLRSFVPAVKGMGFIVEFRKVAGLEEGSEVYVQGVKAGVVEKVTIEPPNTVRVFVRLTEPIPVYKNSRIGIGVGALIPRPYVDITNPEVPGPAISKGDVVRGMEPVSVEEIIPRLVRFIDDFREILGSPETQEQLRGAIADLAESVRNLKRITGAIGPQDVQGSLQRFHSLIARLDELASRPQWVALANNLDQASAHLARLMRDPRMTEELPKTIAEARSAVASLRKLLSDPEVQSRIRSSLVHLERSSQLLETALSDQGTVGRLNDLIGSAEKLVGSVQEIVSDPEVKEGLKKSLTSIESLTAQGRETLKELERSVAELRELTSSSKGDWQKLLANMVSVSEELHAITQGLSWLITQGGLKENLRQIGENLRKSSADLREITEQVRSLLEEEKTRGSLREGLQQVGPTIRIVRRAAEEGERILKRIEPLTRWEAEAAGSVWLNPERDELNADTALNLQTPGLGTGLEIGSHTDKRGTRLNLLIQGKFNRFLMWRSGIVRSKLGLGLGWGTDQFRWDIEAFDPDRWQVNSWLRWSLFPPLSVRVGIEDLGRRRDLGAGLEIRFPR